MSWIQTTPTEEELSRVPAIGSHWISKKIEKYLAENPAALSETNLKHLEIIVTGARFRDDEVEDGLQINFCLAYNPAKTDLFIIQQKLTCLCKGLTGFIKSLEVKTRRKLSKLF